MPVILDDHKLSYFFVPKVACTSLKYMFFQFENGRRFQRFQANGKRVQALGGAKNHAIVMPDADLDNAVSMLMGAAYGSCGERCMAITVVVAVGDETADALVGKLADELAGLKVGPGSDISNNMQVLQESEEPQAREAIELYCYRAASEMGSLLTALGGLDAIVFTAGIGENVPSVRETACAGLSSLGVVIDSVKNSTTQQGMFEIHAAGTTVNADVDIDPLILGVGFGRRF